MKSEVRFIGGPPGIDGRAYGVDLRALRYSVPEAAGGLLTGERTLYHEYELTGTVNGEQRASYRGFEEKPCPCVYCLDEHKENLENNPTDGTAP